MAVALGGKIFSLLLRLKDKNEPEFLGAIIGRIYDSFDNHVRTSANAIFTYIFHNVKRPLN